MRIEKKKKETLEDIIPENVLSYILSIYQTLKQIEGKPLSDFDKVIEKFSMIDDFIQGFMDDKWIDKKISRDLMENIRDSLEAVVFKNYDLDNWLFMKSELETTRTIHDFSKGADYEIVNKRERCREPLSWAPSSYARIFLLATLCAEVREITGKPRFQIVANYLTDVLKVGTLTTGNVRVTNTRIRKSGIMIHIARVLYSFEKLDNYPLKKS